MAAADYYKDSTIRTRYGWGFEIVWKNGGVSCPFEGRIVAEKYAQAKAEGKSSELACQIAGVKFDSGRFYNKEGL